MDRSRILLVEDDANTRAAAEGILRSAGIQVRAVASGEEALACLESVSPDAVLLDLGLPGLGGREVLRSLRERLRHAPVIVLTAERGAEVAVECMKAGAWDYLVKPVDGVRLLTTLANALRQHALARAVAALERAAGGNFPPGLLGSSPAMLALLGTIERVGEGEQPALVTGEPGTERSAVARAVHARSRRAAGPFVTVQCRSLDAGRQASELFGDGGDAGRMAQASGGTLYLEDVEALATSAQERICAALSVSTQVRAGAVFALDFRLVASTTVDLPALVRRKAFRADLYMRLSAAELAVPPLRDRGEDVLLLARHDAGARAQALGIPPCDIAPAALELLRDHPWPGNRDELLRAMERAAESAGAGPIRPSDLALESAGAAPVARVAPGQMGSLRLADVERDAILSALERSSGSRSAASRELGISRATLYRRLKELEIE
jgi:DNA-binding NtrC family response regulator